MSVALVSTAKYTGDSGSDIDNVAAGGFVAIVYPTTASLSGTQCMIVKGGGGASPSLQFSNSGELTMTVQRASSNMIASAALTSFPNAPANTWLMVAGRYNLSASSSGQQLFAARLGQALREPSSYSGQQVGSGTQTDDSAADIFVGNASGGARPTTCPLFAAAMFTTYPDFRELARAARELLVQGRQPIFPGNLARAYRFDRGIGTMVCLKTQNPAVPSGTINLAPDPPRIFAGAMRYAPGVEFAFPAPVATPPATGGALLRYFSRRRRVWAVNSTNRGR